jgi:multidrug resistance efflux pump
MTIQTTITALVVTILFGVGVTFVESYRTDEVPVNPQAPAATEQSNIWAAGRIEGQRRAVELSSRLTEQISEILVEEGDSVVKGDILLTLDSAWYEIQERIAKANLVQAEADLLRVQNGFRQTEVEAAKFEYEALQSRLDGEQRVLDRARRLLESNAESPREYELRAAIVNAFRGQAEAAKNRFLTMQAPPRDHDLKSAEASVAIRRAQHELAILNKDRTQVKSPITGQVMAINAKAGELAGPDLVEPLIVLSDTRSLRVVAEVDDFDAMRVQLGQHATISIDGDESVFATGKVVKIEPQMHRKQFHFDRIGENQDSFARRVWIDLQSPSTAPLGLPVNVLIKPGKST